MPPIFMTKGYLFRGNPVSFEEAFPEIEELKIEGTEGDIMQGRKIFMNQSNFGISCSNPLCKDGGYSPELQDVISLMNGNKETSKEGIIISCKGHENMGRHHTRRCMNHMHILIEIKYKSHAP